MGRKFFGTDGIRDVANTGFLTPSWILRLCRALCAETAPAPGAPRPLLGLAGDTRISLCMIRSALTAGFVSHGWDVVDFGVLPTPGLAFLVRSRGLDLGIMISASHNPMEDNGIKIFDRGGGKLPDPVEEAVERRMEETGEERLPTGASLGRCCPDPGGAEAYLTYLLGRFQGVDLKELKIAGDCANGAGWRIAPELIARLGAQAVVMACDPDGTNINHECGSVHPRKLADLVRAEGCDAGFALDGDGDRCCFVDADGTILDGDHLLAMAAPRAHGRGGPARNGAYAGARLLTGRGAVGAYRFRRGKFLHRRRRFHGLEDSGDHGGNGALPERARLRDAVLSPGADEHRRPPQAAPR